MKRYKIHLIPMAFSDLNDARGWYRKINPELPRKFGQNVKIAMEQIRSLPTAHAIRYKDVRMANIPVFPYAIHYFIEAPNTVIVIAVHHTSIDPVKWQSRK